MYLRIVSASHSAHKSEVLQFLERTVRRTARNYFLQLYYLSSLLGFAIYSSVAQHSYRAAPDNMTELNFACHERQTRPAVQPPIIAKWGQSASVGQWLQLIQEVFLLPGKKDSWIERCRTLSACDEDVLVKTLSKTKQWIANVLPVCVADSTCLPNCLCLSVSLCLPAPVCLPICICRSPCKLYLWWSLLESHETAPAAKLLLTTQRRKLICCDRPTDHRFIDYQFPKQTHRDRWTQRNGSTNSNSMSMSFDRHLSNRHTAELLSKGEDDKKIDQRLGRRKELLNRKKETIDTRTRYIFKEEKQSATIKSSNNNGFWTNMLGRRRSRWDEIEAYETISLEWSQCRERGSFN